MKYWLVKTEPETYGWRDLEAKEEDIWDGVRNYQARNYMKEMEAGDPVLVYHSGKSREIVGLAKVSASAYPDPSDKENKGWVSVNLSAQKPLSVPVALARIKEEDALQEMALLKQSRLSVMPLTQSEFEYILKIAVR
jgi:predicted RNA-binding protein with PUA-like domain